jgi:putative sterol carrier protein
MAAPQSAHDLFNVQMPKALEKAPDKAREVGSNYVFKITGEGGGEWTVDLKSSEPKIHQGILPGADCTIEIAHADFIALLGSPALGMQLFMQGKLKVSGDPMLAMKLQKLFSIS